MRNIKYGNHEEYQAFLFLRAKQKFHIPSAEVAYNIIWEWLRNL